MLVWAILYSGPTPGDEIRLDGQRVVADVTATVSGTLCWGDDATVGYAADVTDLVNGNGDYVVSDPPRGSTRVESNPRALLPYTDGASLVIFYVGGGSNSQILSDFTYNTNTDAETENAIVRSFDGVQSVGVGGSLTLTGPDGQTNFGEVFTITGAGTPLVLTDTWDGSDAQPGPSFPIGNLWDTDVYDVGSVLPAGQTALTVTNRRTTDCIGVSAAVLEIPQALP